MELVTLTDIIGAGDVTSEAAARRRRRFIDYQERGLIGHAVSKEPRRGGAGLWHPAQARLWELYERQRGQVRPETLANAPVGTWLLEIPGIELPQVQRAFVYWCRAASPRDREPAGERSGYRRRLNIAADTIADPTAIRSTRYQLRRVIAMISDAQGMIVRRKTIEEKVFAAMSPTGEEQPNARRFASNYSLAIESRYLALSYLESFGRPESQALWIWARDWTRAGYADYQHNHEKLSALPVVGRFFAREPDLNEFMNSACANLLLMFGIGIRLLAHDRSVRLPPGVPMPPESLAPMFAAR